MDNSGSKIVMCGFWGTPYAQVTWCCACAVNFVAFTMGKSYFSPVIWLNLRRSAPKVTHNSGMDNCTMLKIGYVRLRLCPR